MVQADLSYLVRHTEMGQALSCWFTEYQVQDTMVEIRSQPSFLPGIPGVRKHVIPQRTEGIRNKQRYFR